jgi:alcohol dehydrogenase YqhD (iron-dependent ADH family)
MYPFCFQNETRVIFGRDKITSLGKEVKRLGDSVLLVYGRNNFQERGLHEAVHKMLSEEGLKVIDHGNIRPNPLLGRVREGIAAARFHRINIVLAIGGGSVMDSAKAIAAGLPVNHDVWQFFKAKRGIRSRLPLVCVPTIAGSGSELNGGMVLTNEELHQKIGIGHRLLHPDLAVLDSALTETVPVNHTIYGAVDIIAHVLEHFFTAGEEAIGLQERFLASIVTTVMECCDRLVHKPHDMDARATMLWCGSLALSGYPTAGTGKIGFPMHLVEHSLSALYDIPHGAGLAVVIPAWMRFQTARDHCRISRFADLIFGMKENSRAAAYGAADRLQEWFTTQKCPTTLADLGVNRLDIPHIARNALPQAKLWRQHDYGEETIANILTMCE